MSDKWEAIVEVWPYSSIPQGLAGPRSVRLIIGGNDIGEAVEAVQLFTKGILLSPAVWQAPIVSVARCDDQHAHIGDCRPHDCAEADPANYIRLARELAASARP